MSEIRFHILGLCGSLRRQSYNLRLLETVKEFLPEKVDLTIYEGLDELPAYNEDIHTLEEPKSVRQLREAIRECRALLIATPEYNYGIPGFLKNALDWVSTPPQQNPLRGKAVGLMGASSGGSGTIRAQLSLRQTLLYTDSMVMLKPELLIAHAPQYFDSDFNITDQAIRDHLRRFLLSFLVWSKKVAALK